MLTDSVVKSRFCPLTVLIKPVRGCELLLFKQNLFTVNFGLLQPREGAKHVADHPTRGRERECVLAVSLRKCDLTETQRWSEQRAK